MEPTWQSDDGRAQLFLGDCLEVLPYLSGIHCTVTSPPYNQRLETFKASGMVVNDNSSWAERAASSYCDSMDEDEYQQWQTSVLDAVWHVTEPDGSVFYNHKCRWRNKVILHPLDLFRRSRWALRQEIVWARDGSLTLNAKMFPPAEERVIWGFRDSWRWNADANQWMSVWRICSDHHSEHPVAYPIEIPRRCILATTSPGDTVLDPFAGSSTTGVAAIREGRKFVGIEKDPGHFESSKRRLQDALGMEFKEKCGTTQKRMFGQDVNGV